MAILLSFSFVARAQPVQPLTLPQLCQQEPARIKALFAALNLDYPGLETTKQFVASQQWPEACMALVTYYRQAKSGAWFRTGTTTQSNAPQLVADAILADTYTFQEITGKLGRLADGGLNWHYLGPNSDKEWGWFLNRFSAFNTLLSAWKQTGNPAYAQAYDRFVTDWVLHNPMPAKRQESATWRVLETGLRMMSPWPNAFYGFQQADGFSPAARILALCSVPDHADYLMKYHVKNHNHAAMELNGLATLALSWPEFRQSEEWYQHTVEKMNDELELQVYPDGAQKELTSMYHTVTLDNFEQFYKTSQKAGRTLTGPFTPMVEKMYNYLAYTLRPDGYGLLNNDSDLINNRTKLRGAANIYNRPDWSYIISNGKEGVKPATGPSVVFPWAGQVVNRSGWGADAQWSFFDIGPWGMSHQHNDKLNVTVYANGRELLVDAGRMYYKPDSWRRHFNLSESHNVVLLDGKGQNQYEGITSKPLSDTAVRLLPDVDFSIGTFADGFGDKWNRHKPFQYHQGTDSIPGRHTRAVLFLHDTGATGADRRPGFWIVFDRVETDKPRTLSPLWHFHPQCKVTTEQQSVVTTDAGKGNLRIIPVAPFDWTVSLIKGQEDPIQGWYSEAYNKKEPNVCAIYKAATSPNATFAWVLYPAVGDVPAVRVEQLAAPEGSMHLKIMPPGQPTIEVAASLTSPQAIRLSDGSQFLGRCVVLRANRPPVVVQGKLTSQNGTVLATGL